MAIDLSLFDKKIPIDSIQLELNNGTSVPLAILRLDQLHHTLSGNKWFKLKYNLLEAEKIGAATIISFGGAYSNHLHALAYAGKLFNIPTIGYVRGEAVSNPTLEDCRAWGMELRFISRDAYRKKTSLSFLETIQKAQPNSYIIPEGGDNTLGQKGCEEILPDGMNERYNTLCCALGTGTTLSGLAACFHKKIWGFAPFKNAFSLKEKLAQQIPPLEYIDAYHFGGFGKTKPELIDFAAQFKLAHNIELDKIYTAKMFWGLRDMLSITPPEENRKIIVIHTGGLQGNRPSNS